MQRRVTPPPGGCSPCGVSQPRSLGHHVAEPLTNAKRDIFVAGTNLTRGVRAVPTILIIDDEASIAEVMAEVLLDEGYATLTANHGREALALIATCRPDLMLLDLFMPEMSGLDVLAHMQHDAALALIPVVMMTAGSISDLDLSHKGVIQVMSKPFSLDELIATVRTLL